MTLTQALASPHSSVSSPTIKLLKLPFLLGMSPCALGKGVWIRQTDVCTIIAVHDLVLWLIGEVGPFSTIGAEIACTHLV